MFLFVIHVYFYFILFIYFNGLFVSAKGYENDYLVVLIVMEMLHY
jgi:hypothetical protein